MWCEEFLDDVAVFLLIKSLQGCPSIQQNSPGSIGLFGEGEGLHLLQSTVDIYGIDITNIFRVENGGERGIDIFCNLFRT